MPIFSKAARNDTEHDPIDIKGQKELIEVLEPATDFRQKDGRQVLETVVLKSTLVHGLQAQRKYAI